VLSAAPLVGGDEVLVAVKGRDGFLEVVVIGLKGVLGVGKTFFARSFINSLSYENQVVQSPTFNILYSYKTKKFEIFHFDLYRIKESRELENIGFFDCLKNGVCLIEWPEVASEVLKNMQENYLEIDMRIIENDWRMMSIR
jgi:tRNA threonylcarbamoyladenosine biosynthesis protein TsaE